MRQQFYSFAISNFLYTIYAFIDASIIMFTLNFVLPKRPVFYIIRNGYYNSDIFAWRFQFGYFEPA